MTGSLELSGALARQFPAIAQRLPILDRRPVATAVVTAVTGLGVYFLVLLTGGTPNAFGHAAYIPIAIAAYRAGLRGGLIAGAIGTVMLGPVMYLTDLEHNSEFGNPWLIRGVFFMGLGSMLGWLFTRARQMTVAWREAALQVTANHHEGMEALARAAEAKDPTTGTHMYRCRDLASALATEVGLRDDLVAEIAWSAMLHDLGKLYVPDHVLTKPGELDPDEWALVRQHPVRGAELLGRAQTFEVAWRIARWHHENLNGSGYPDGLRGSAIPLEARIVRIVDSWDAMTNDRPYRLALPRDRAMSELHDGAGSLYDPDLVDLFLKFIARGA